MIHALLREQVRKNIHIVAYEKFISEGQTVSIERFIGKHPLLKPELIVVNDQAYGFKRLKKELLRLEHYPIYIEIEHTQQPDMVSDVTNFDLYTEVPLITDIHQDDIGALCDQFKRTVSMDVITSLASRQGGSVVLYSTLTEALFADDFLDTLEDNGLSEDELSDFFREHMVSFLTCIKVFDDFIKSRS